MSHHFFYIRVFLFAVVPVWLVLILNSQVAAEDSFLGVATCASSQCHGGASPRDASNVLQNEYTTWFRHDAHSRAFETLLKSDSKRIGKHLGIEQPETDPLCLQCHSTYVPNALRGDKFRLSDGVGCESCHGASSRYIKSHTERGRTHQQNLQDGMTDLFDLHTRATTCLECHHGTDEQDVNHRLIGAGHPRLTFELDTYTALQPKHFQVDADYIKRKGKTAPTHAWLLGQALRAEAMLEALQSKVRGEFYGMPELSRFYCYSCHHSLEEKQWQKREYGNTPGELRLNTSSLDMLMIGIDVVDKSIAANLKAHLAELHNLQKAGSASGTISKISTLLNSELLPAVSRMEFTNQKALELFDALVRYCTARTHLPYEVAEQCAMAISASDSQLHPDGKPLRDEIRSVYTTLENEASFQPEAFTKALQKLRNQTPQQ